MINSMKKMLFKVTVVFLVLITTSFFKSVGATPTELSLQNNISPEFHIPALLLDDVKYLSSDELAGRKPETRGHVLAQDYIIDAYKQSNLKPITPNYRQSFSYKKGFNSKSSTNIIGLIEGNKYPNYYWVITAHYDHLGKLGSKIYNGANDNASGVAALIAMVRYFTKIPPAYNLIFVATDGEEDGLHGSKYFVDNPPVMLSSILLNINMDMIGHGSRKKRLYIAGTRRHPILKAAISPLIDKLSSTLMKLKFGHDGISRSRVSNNQRVNWKQASDHAAFIKKGITYLYFGVEVNSTYHKVNDTFQRLDTAFYIEAVDSILEITNSIQQLSPEQLLSKELKNKS